jgi:hypothetical protein
MFSLIFIVFVLIFMAAFITIVAGFIMHASVFSRIFNVVNRQLDQRIAAMDAAPAARPTAEDPPAHERRCDHCGSKVAAVPACPNCGASLS